MPNPLPPSVAESDLSRQIQAAGLVRKHQGKVRDTYSLSRPGHRLVVTTDRTSAFDFNLGQNMPGKGVALNLTNVFWKDTVLADVPNDQVAAGAGIDEFVPKELQGNQDLQMRAVVAEELNMRLAECIARGILTGTAWKMYKAGERRLWGYDPLPDGMNEWDALPFSMFTPTDKADSGHDEPVTRASVSDLEEPTIKLYDRGRKYARERRLILVDTKFEFGWSSFFGAQSLGDEVFTPDSSRYLDEAEFEEDRRLGRNPRSFDKQIIRDYLKNARLNGRAIDVSKLDPKSAEDRALVASIQLPEEVALQTMGRYFDLLQRLTGKSLADYCRQDLGIAA